MLIPVDTYIVMFLFNHNAREKKKKHAWNVLWQTRCPCIRIHVLKIQNYYKVMIIPFGSSNSLPEVYCVAWSMYDFCHQLRTEIKTNSLIFSPKELNNPENKEYHPSSVLSAHSDYQFPQLFGIMFLRVLKIFMY